MALFLELDPGGSIELGDDILDSPNVPGVDGALLVEIGSTTSWGSPMWGDVSIIVERWDGTLYRWAGDELDAANVPCDLVYTTSVPGGFKTCTCTLFRSILEPAPEGLFDDLKILGPGGQIYWEGRLQSMPSSTADGGRINPSAVGWSAHLEDRQDATRIYVDRDLTRWGPVTAKRRQALNDVPVRVIDGTQAWDDHDVSGGPVLRLWRDKGEPSWTSNAGRPYACLAYDAGGAELSSAEAVIHRPVGVNYSGWYLQSQWWPSRAQDGTGAGSDAVVAPNLASGVKWIITPTATARAVELSLLYGSAPGGSADAEYGLQLAEVAVYGRSMPRSARTHSMLLGAGQGPWGVYADGVVVDALQSFAPLLRVDPESVQQTSYPIPHLVFREPTTAAQMIELANRFHWWDWAVWEDRRFWFHGRFGGQSRTWLVSTADGADLDLEGDTTDVIFNGCVVSYTDFAGHTHTVGPPGSTAERTDSRLLSQDPDNPATSHGIHKWGHFHLSEPVDLEGAILCGMAWLDAQSLATRRGMCTIAGTVIDEHGNDHPVDMIRAGDKLIVTDRPDDPPRRIIETSVVRASRTNTLTLDNTAQTLEALLERMGASLVGVL